MHYHLVGIAGSGMGGIAHLLRDQGHQVSGCDPAAHVPPDDLAARGVPVEPRHAPGHVAGADALVVTSAVPDGHVELQAARARGVPVLRRADLWREWSSIREVVAVAGTAGKTTTTAMTALILQAAGLEPGWLVGGFPPDLGRAAVWGRGPLVIEADEYDRTFLALTPLLAVITNIQFDHVDCFPTLASYQAAFDQFATQVRGAVVRTCPGDTPAVAATPGPHAAALPVPAFAHSRWEARAVQLSPATRALVWHDQQPVGVLTLMVPGRHNLENALGALALAMVLGVPAGVALAALARYHGTRRRFEIKGEVHGITVIDDYAHHPDKARATVAAARARYPGRRLLVYTQPHTYSRTAALLDDWPAAFDEADVVLVGAIYAAREADPGTIDGQQLAQRIAARHPAVEYVGEIAPAAERLAALARPGDVVLTLGAGDSYRVADDLLRRLGEEP